VATSILLNTVNVGTQVFYAGSEVDSAYDDVAAIRACGGRLWSSSDTVIGAASALCKKKIALGANDGIDSIMQAAVASLFSDDPNEAGSSGNFGATYLRTIQTVSPASNATDAAGLQAAETAMGSVGRTVAKPGTFVIAAATRLPSHSLVELHSATQLVSTIDQPLVYVTHWNGIFNGYSDFNGSVGTLASTPTLGSRTLSVTGFVPVEGRAIQVSHTVSASTYVIKKVTGAGPYTVTVDRALVFPWVSGDTVQEITTLAQDMRIDGHGGQLRGLGGQGVEFARVFRVKVRDLHFDPSDGIPTGAAFGTDLGCWESLYEDCSADLTGAMSAAGAATTTFTADASTDILTTAGLDDLKTGTRVQVSTTTTLPAGLAAATNYYVIRVSISTIKLATSLANALAGTAIDITSAGTGTHTITLQNVSQNGFYFQSNERSAYSRCVAKRAPIGFGIYDCFQTGASDCWATDCPSYGFVVGTLYDTTASLGNFECWIRGGGAVSCATGLYVFGTRRLTVSSFTAKACSTYGIYVDVGPHSEVTDGITLVGCQTPQCTTGVYINTGVTGAVVQGLDVSGCTTYGLQANADVFCTNLVARASSMTAVVYVQGSSRTRLISGIVENSKPGGFGVISTTTCDVRDYVCKMTGGGAAIAYYAAGGAMFLEGCSGTGSTGGSIGLKVVSGAVATIGANCDLSAYEFPVSVDAGGTLYMVPQHGLGAVTVTGANVTATWAQYRPSTIRVSGLVTGSRRNLILPHITGHIWTIKCDTTGALGIQVIGSSGTGVNVSDGTVVRVYFDGTNFVQV